MNEFLKSLTAYGMEGMNVEEVFVEEYANSECAEELIELDNLDQACIAMEAMQDAIMESGLEMQTLALEAAGFTLDTASGFTGELSNEAVGNMIKRGYYEVKIQIKKAVHKIWKLIVATVESLLGSEGRLKSYGKLFKKYCEKLVKLNPADNKDGEDRDVTVREWNNTKVVFHLKVFKGIADRQAWKGLTEGIKKTDPVAMVAAISTNITSLCKAITDAFNKVESDTTKQAEAAKKLDLAKTTITGLSKKEAEELEKKVDENMGDVVKDLKDELDDFLKDMKDIDSDEMSIWKAKEMLYTVGRALEAECKKDVKFKQTLIKLRKAWDKTTGNWDMSKSTGNNQDVKDAAAAILRILNKCGSAITGIRLGLSKFYKAIASNMQGVLADMAKVIAKGTNIRSN